MRQTRSAAEVEQIVEQYQSSGMTQLAYCRQQGIALSTFGRYLKQQRRGQRLVKVNLEERPVRLQDGFVLVLGNKRRIESGWRSEVELARLIRVAEAVS